MRYSDEWKDAQRLWLRLGQAAGYVSPVWCWWHDDWFDGDPADTEAQQMMHSLDAGDDVCIPCVRLLGTHGTNPFEADDETHA